MNTRKPIWLLDVDGVLNAVAKDFPNTWDDWMVDRLNGFFITWSPQMMKRIVKMIDDGLVEVRWLTTWGEQANQFLCGPLELPHFEVSAEMDKTGWGFGVDGWWKLPAAQISWEENRPVVWTDDDIEYSHDAMEWLDEVAQGARYDEMLAITPRTPIGLTPEHIDQIESFCKKWVTQSAV